MTACKQTGMMWLAVCLAEAAVRADLTGTSLDIVISHGLPIPFSHTYGTTQTVPHPNAPAFTFSVTSPSPTHVPFDNSIMINFAGFAYGDYSGQTGTITIDSIAEEVLPTPALYNGFLTPIGSISGAGNSISGSWSVNEVINPGSTVVIVAWNSVPPPCPWDLDGCGAVGVVDLLELLAAWGTDPGGPPDFDGSGDVGITDFLDLLAHWGVCPNASPRCP